MSYGRPGSVIDPDRRIRSTAICRRPRPPSATASLRTSYCQNGL